MPRSRQGAPAVVLVDREARILQADPRAAALLGMTGEPLVGRPITAILPGLRSPLDAALSDPTAKDRLDPEVLLTAGPSVDQRTVRALVRPLTGGSVGAAILLNEVTSPAPEARREDAAAFPENNPQPVFQTDLDGELTYMNPAAQRMVPGLTGEGGGNPFLDGLARIARRLEDGEEDLLVREICIGDRCLEEHITLDSARDRLHIYTVEITDRKRSERALEESEQRFRQLAENTDQVFVLAKADRSQILYANPAFQRLWQTPVEALYEDAGLLFAGIHEDDQPRVREVIDRVSSGDEDHADHRFRLVRPDGSTRWVHHEVFAIADDQGRVPRVAGLFQDITDQVGAERSLKEKADELAESNEELARFAYVASHDLREPLRTVMSFAQLLERQYLDELDGEGQELIGYIKEGVERLDANIRGLNTYAKAEREGAGFEPLEMDNLFDTITETLGKEIQETGAMVTRDDLPRIRADRAQMGLVLQNLISNAIKFTRAGQRPMVHVTAERGEEAWRVMVADDGIGIPPEHHDQIFTVFKRLHTRDKYPGTGVGLAICRKVVERHGGEIWVDSEEGEGATFTFTIPRRGVPRGPTPELGPAELTGEPTA